VEQPAKEHLRDAMLTDRGKTAFMSGEGVKRPSGKTRSAEGIDSRDLFGLRRSARRSNFRPCPGCTSAEGAWPLSDVFSAGCCIPNVFTLAPDPVGTLARASSLCAAGISA